MNLQGLNNINFFRIFFTLMIVYGHIIQHFMMPMYGELPFFQHMSRHLSYSFGYMCDMFFIISGFFMFFSFKKHHEFIDFILTKVVRLLPVLLFSLLSVSVLSFILTGVEYYKYNNFLALFFLDDAFIANFSTSNAAAWYINVLFWGNILYYCLTNAIPKEKVKYVIGLLTFFAYSILLNKMELYNGSQVWLDGVLTISMLRGIAGMGLGYLIGEWYSNSNYVNIKPKNNIRSSIFFTIIELLALIFIFKFAIIKYLTFNFANKTVLFIILFILFLTKKGFLSRITDNNIIFNLGKYCYSIYVMQEVMFRILVNTFWKNSEFISIHPVLTLIYSVSLICLFGIIVYYLIEKPATNIFNKIRMRNYVKE